MSKNIMLNYISWHPARYKCNAMYNLVLRALRLKDKIYLKEIRFRVFNLLIDSWSPLELIRKCWDRCRMVQTQVTPQEETEMLEVVNRDRNNTPEDDENSWSVGIRKYFKSNYYSKEGRGYRWRRWPPGKKAEKI